MNFIVMNKDTTLIVSYTVNLMIILTQVVIQYIG